MTYTIAEWTVNNLLMMDRGTVRNMQSFMKNKFLKLVHLLGFILKKFLTMHGHMNVKKGNMLSEAYQVTLYTYSPCSYLNTSESFVCYKHSCMKNRICQVVLHKITFDLWRNRNAFLSVCVQKQARSVRTVTAELQLYTLRIQLLKLHRYHVFTVLQVSNRGLIL